MERLQYLYAYIYMVMESIEKVQTSIKFPLRKQKVIPALLYIIDRMGGNIDMYSLLKIIYFAEIDHLVKYGRPIIGDRIIAMDNGPVPSIAYDKVKHSKITLPFKMVEDNIITSREKADLDFLSNSDQKCLELSFQENRHLSFTELRAKSHDAAYHWTVNNFGLNKEMPCIEIAKSAGASDEMIELITEMAEDAHLSIHE